MKEQPLVSVIIPNYNHARYLEQRLDSVFNQTYQNIEVIFLDDCSTDNSLEMIEKYKGNPRLSQIVVNETNSGSVFKQWNKGISLAKGELIWIAESDDFCELNMLECLVNAYRHHRNTVLVYSPTVFVNDEGIPCGAYSIEGRTQHITGRGFIKKYLTVDNGVYNASCAIFSKRAAMNANKDYMNWKGIGDWWFWIYVAQQGDVVMVNKHMNYFRQHGNNTTARLSTEGTNIRDVKVLLDYIYRCYNIPKWKKTYIDKMHRDRYACIKYINQGVADEMKKLWRMDYEYSKWELFCCRVLNHLQRRYLLRL